MYIGPLLFSLALQWLPHFFHSRIATGCSGKIEVFCVAASDTRGKPSTIEQQQKSHAMITLCCLGLPGIRCFSASFDIYLWRLSHHFAMWLYLYHYKCGNAPNKQPFSTALQTSLSKQYLIKYSLSFHRKRKHSQYCFILKPSEWSATTENKLPHYNPKRNHW